MPQDKIVNKIIIHPKHGTLPEQSYYVFQYDKMSTVLSRFYIVTI